MRFSLYGQGEGIRVECAKTFFASVQADKVTDSSVSARQKGILPGMSQKSAEALLPVLTVISEQDQPTEMIERIWRLLWSYSPWLQTIDKDAFWFQLSGNTPPIQEVRDVLLKIDATLSNEQRFRVGLAENPFLARALVEWSRIEKIPHALYRKVNRQHLILSPSLVKTSDYEKEQLAIVNWLSRMPLQSVWTISSPQREALIRLGVHRLGELAKIPVQQLVLHFGKEAILWPKLLQQKPGGVVKTNYPPFNINSKWKADLNEKPSLRCVAEIVQGLAGNIASTLGRMGTGAMKIGIRWTTDERAGEFERVCKHPVHQSEDIAVHLKSSMDSMIGEVLEEVELYATDIRPLFPIQSSFVLKEHVFYTERTVLKANVEDVFAEINSRFPNRLNYGLTSPFRELRLEAVQSVL